MTVQSTNSKSEPLSTDSSFSLVERARGLAKDLAWLSPIEKLDSSAGREFGRQIESSLNDLMRKQEALLIRLRKKDAAIVMTVAQYEEMIRLKNLCMELLAEVKEKAIADAGDEFDQLFAQISSPQSRQAADLLFTAPAESLANTYKPGETEGN